MEREKLGRGGAGKGKMDVREKKIKDMTGRGEEGGGGEGRRKRNVGIVGSIRNNSNNNAIVINQKTKQNANYGRSNSTLTINFVAHGNKRQ